MAKEHSKSKRWGRKRARQGSQNAAAERLSTPDQLDQVIQVVRFPHWMALAALILVLITGLIASFVLPIPVTVRGEGILINIGGILAVTAQSEGRVTALRVQPGDTVQPGDVVAQLDQPWLQQTLEDLRAELAEAERRLETIRDFQERTERVQNTTIQNRRLALEQRHESAADRLELLEEQLEIETKLSEDGIISTRKPGETRTRVNQARDELLAIESDIEAFAETLTNSELEHERERLDAQLEINDLKRRVRSQEKTLRYASEVKSPYAGRVVELMINPGEIVSRNRSLFSLLPTDTSSGDGTGGNSDSDGDSDGDDDGDGPNDDGSGDVVPPANRSTELVAVLYVPPKDGKKIEPGMPVQLELSSIKREEFGFMLGEVRSVAEVPSTAEGMMRSLKNRQLVQQLSQENAPFEVVVEPNRDPRTPSGYEWSSSAGPDAEINVGTLCVGDVVTDRKTPLSLILPAFGRWLDERRSADGP